MINSDDLDTVMLAKAFNDAIVEYDAKMSGCEKRITALEKVNDSGANIQKIIEAEEAALKELKSVNITCLSVLREEHQQIKKTLSRLEMMVSAYEELEKEYFISENDQRTVTFKIGDRDFTFPKYVLNHLLRLKTMYANGQSYLFRDPDLFAAIMKVCMHGFTLTKIEKKDKMLMEELAFYRFINAQKEESDNINVPTLQIIKGYFNLPTIDMLPKQIRKQSFLVNLKWNIIESGRGYLFVPYEYFKDQLIHGMKGGYSTGLLNQEDNFAMQISSVEYDNRVAETWSFYDYEDDKMDKILEDDTRDFFILVTVNGYGRNRLKDFY